MQQARELGLVVGSVEEGDHLGSVAVGVGTELVGGDAGGDAVFQSPEDGLVEEVGGGHIGEGDVGEAGLGCRG